MITATYRNTKTGELKTISFDRPHGSNSDQLVNSHKATVRKATGWKLADIAAQMVIVSA